MIRDNEDLMRSILEFVKSNINSKISAINTEKGDFLIKPIPEDGQHFVVGGELLDLPNHDFVNIGFNGNVAAKSIKGDYISVPNFAVEVCFDNPKTINTFFKSLRYMRALLEVLKDYELSALEADGVEITEGIPMLVPIKNRSIVVCGVYISVAIS